jgi:hypothetical protein
VVVRVAGSGVEAPATVVVVASVDDDFFGSEVTQAMLTWASVKTGRRYLTGDLDQVLRPSPGS